MLPESAHHPSTKMSISAAKILSTLPKSNLYLQHETKIMKSGEKRADDQNSGAISTDCLTTRWVLLQVPESIVFALFPTFCG